MASGVGTQTGARSYSDAATSSSSATIYDITPETPEPEPLSPELALVDPALAAAAREELPDVPESPSPRNAAYAFAPRFAEEYERAAHETAVEDARRPQRRRRYLSWVAALLAIPLAVGLIVLRGGENVQSARPNAPDEPAPRSEIPAPPASPPTDDGTASQASKPTSAPRSSAPRASRPTKAGSGRQPAAAQASPIVRWTPAPKATFYWFQLYRLGPGALKILDRWPRRARLRLPRAWRNAGVRYQLEPGRYRWEVWPQYGARSEVRFTRMTARGTLAVGR